MWLSEIFHCYPLDHDTAISIDGSVNHSDKFGHKSSLDYVTPESGMPFIKSVSILGQLKSGLLKRRAIIFRRILL